MGFKVRHRLQLILTLGLLIASGVHAEEKVIGKVIGVHDGDTVKIEANGEEIAVRLANIDCPELHQELGPEARNFAQTKILNKRVHVLIQNQDRYSRSIGVIEYDNGNILNKDLVENGLCWWYPAYSKDKSYQVLQDKAKYNHVGLWSPGRNPTPPWVYRKSRRVH